MKNINHELGCKMERIREGFDGEVWCRVSKDIFYFGLRVKGNSVDLRMKNSIDRDIKDLMGGVEREDV